MTYSRQCFILFACAVDSENITECHNYGRYAFVLSSMGVLVTSNIYIGEYVDISWPYVN